MGKKEQLEQIVSLLSSEKILKNESGNVNITQEDLDTLIPLFIAETQDTETKYSYNSNTKELKCTITDSEDPDQSWSHTGTITDADSFMNFIGAVIGIRNPNITEQKIEEIAALYSSGLPSICGQSLFDDTNLGLSECASNNRELVMESIKETYPMCIKLMLTYLKLVQQISN